MAERMPLRPFKTEAPDASRSPGSSATEFLVHADPEWQAALGNLHEDLSAVLEEVPLDGEPEADRSERLPLAYLQQTNLDMEVRPLVLQVGEDEGSSSAELAIYPLMTNTVPDAPPIAPDHMLVYKITSHGTRRMVTQRGDNLLTPEKACQRWREVEAAMLNGLTTRAELKGFS